VSFALCQKLTLISAVVISFRTPSAKSDRPSLCLSTAPTRHRANAKHVACMSSRKVGWCIMSKWGRILRCVCSAYPVSSSNGGSDQCRS
jgi:hypothetical protein